MSTTTRFNAKEFITSGTTDFYKYYDTTQKRNVWALGYFGGGSIPIVDAMEMAKEYAAQTGVPVETVVISEILQSTRYKYFKIMYSITNQLPQDGAHQMPNVYDFLCR